MISGTKSWMTVMVEEGLSVEEGREEPERRSRSWPGEGPCKVGGVTPRYGSCCGASFNLFVGILSELMVGTRERREDDFSGRRKRSLPGGERSEPKSCPEQLRANSRSLGLPFLTSSNLMRSHSNSEPIVSGRKPGKAHHAATTKNCKSKSCLSPRNNSTKAKKKAPAYTGILQL